MIPSPDSGLAARRMRSNVRWSLLGNAIYAAGQWCQILIFARLGGPAAVGAFAFSLALTAPVMMFGYLQLRTLLASDARSSYDFFEYRCLRIATTAASLLVVTLIAWSSEDGRRFWPVLLPVCGMRAADALADIYYGLWQLHERMRVIGLGLALNSVASLGFMVAFAALGGGTAGAATGSAAGSCVALAFIHLRTAADGELQSSLGARATPVERRRLLRLTLEAVPLGLIVLLGSLQANAPRYFVQHYAGTAALGLFAAASQLTSAGTILVGALGSAVTPRLGRICAMGDASAFRTLARELVLTAAILGALGVAFSAALGRQALVLLFRPEFSEAWPLLVVLSAAAGVGFVATLLGYILTAARVIAVQPILLAATLVVAVAGCAALAPTRGAMGAAWALVPASVVQAIWSAVALSRFRMGPQPSSDLGKAA